MIDVNEVERVSVLIVEERQNLRRIKTYLKAVKDPFDEISNEFNA